jgi:hypothetical protein
MDNPVEILRSRWLSGRGTRFLYIAILVTIVGVLMMGSKAPSESAVTPEQAVGLAVEVSTLCKKPEFLLQNQKACDQAYGILGGAPGGVGGAGTELVDAVGASR